MRRRRRRWSRSLAKLAIGLRKDWVTKLQVFKFQTGSAHHLVFLYLGSLVGLPTWRGEVLSNCWLVGMLGVPFEAYLMENWNCRLMKAQAVGDTSSLDFMRGRRVFEINPEHPIIKNLNVWSLIWNILSILHKYMTCKHDVNLNLFWWLMQAACKSGPDDEEALRAIDLLYDTALISSGFTVSLIIPLLNSNALMFWLQ